MTWLCFLFGGRHSPLTFPGTTRNLALEKRHTATT